MRSFRRFAVYIAPRPDSALGRFGAAWLGWDAEAGTDCAAPEPARRAALPRPREALVATPRRYGFHGTLKAPFRLAEAHDFDALDAALQALAGEFAAFDLPLRLSAPGPFLALTAARGSAALDALAAACVTRLDAFRAPLAAAEIARRRAAALSPAEDANLLRWGYPHVLAQFRFHMTLTGALTPDVRAATAAALEGALAPLLVEPMAFADLCLFGEAEDGMFHVVRRHALLAAAAGSP